MASLLLLGCEGPQGPAGPKGDPGDQGDPGTPGDPGDPGAGCTSTDNGDGTYTITCGGTDVTVNDGTDGTNGTDGVSTGTIHGTVTSTSGAPAYGVEVQEVPDRVTGAVTTGADGTYSIASVPIGTYSIVFKAGTAYAADVTVTNVSVTSGGTVTVDATLTPKVTVGRSLVNVGFGGQELNPAGTGQIAGDSYKWHFVSGPTTATFSDDTAQNPTVSLCTLEACIASGKAKYLVLPDRASLVSLAPDQVAAWLYTFQVDVTTGGVTTTKYVQMNPVAIEGATETYPLDVVAIVSGTATDVTTYDWSFTAVPSGSAYTVGGKLNENDKRQAWFKPDAEGMFVAASGADSITVIAAKYVGVNASGTTFAYGARCNGCHPAAVAEWAPSGHATMLELSLKGLTSNHYGPNCVSCHSAGYTAGASNNGFDDNMSGWTFPTIPDPGDPTSTNFDDMPLALKARAGINCESCHGPASQHPGGDAAKMDVNYSAGACGQCHGSGSHHDKWALFEQSAHANYAEVGHTARDSCGTCHTAQGFVQWRKNCENPDYDECGGNLMKPVAGGADVAYTAAELADMGITAAAAHPVTCQACHEPHTLELRVKNDTGNTHAGFRAQGYAIGAGALCMTCHNNRRGRRDDGVVASNYEVPHRGPQGDVFMGVNAYFMGDLSSQPDVSKHLYASAGSCVGCHMQNAPEGLTVANTNHTFRADQTVCAKCHGEAIAENLTLNVEEGLDNVVALIGLDAAKRIGAQTVTYAPRASAGSSATGTMAAVDHSTNPVAKAEYVGEIYRQMGLKITLTNAVDINYGGTTTSTKEFYVQLGGIKDASNANVFAYDDVVAKAMWNYVLFENDASWGGHNPSFVMDALWNTAEALSNDLATP